MHPARRTTARLATLAMLGLVLLAPAAQAYKLIGPRWPVSKFPIAWKLDVDGSSDINDTSDKTAVQNAFNAWNQVGGTRAAVASYTDLASNALTAGDDNVNKVFWVEDASWRYGQYTLGVTTPLYYTTGEIFDADIVFNGRDYAWRTGSGRYCSNCTDVFSIAIHEEGHFFGLDHSCSPASSGNGDDCGSGAAGTQKRDAVMFAAYPGYPKQALTADDIAGIRALYPAPTPGSGTQGSGCVDNVECAASLACTSSGGVKICAAACTGTGTSTCATGYSCQSGRCLYAANEVGELCKACSAPGDCANGLCIGTSDFAICARTCGTGANQGCPANFGCYVENQGDTTGFCYPESNTCPGNCSATNACPTGQECVSGSCRWASGGEGEECPSGACDANLTCVGSGQGDYRCRRNCTTTSQCPVNQVCLPLQGGGGACFPGGTVDVGGECESANDCKIGLLCISSGAGATTGTCFKECTPGGAASQCATDEECQDIGDTGVCVEDTTTPPTRVAECEACGGSVLCNTGLLCIAANGANTCQKRCTADSQCGTNKRCATVGSNRFCTCNTGTLKGDGVACAADAECQVGLQCVVDGVSAGPSCRKPCVAAADCTGTQACTAAAGATYCLPETDPVTPDAGTGPTDPNPNPLSCLGCAAADPATLGLALLLLARRRRRAPAA